MSYVVEDCRGMLKLLNDGTIIRAPLPSPPPDPTPTPYHSITFQDITYDQTHNLSLRRYKPTTPSSTIILYIHGGGFCLGSRTMPTSNNLCLRLAYELGVEVVSVDYRLAPEDRLPSGVDDCWHALEWVCKGCEGDERVFVFGDSAGGNVAANLAVRVANGGLDLSRVRVKGFVLLGPMFGGSERTQSELDGDSHTFLSLDALDRYWRLCLPVGETPDYELVNPFGPRSPNLESLNLGPMLIMVGETDVLRDRVKDYATKLSSWGKKVEYVEFKGLAHGFLITGSDPEPANQVLRLINKFISENTGKISCTKKL